MRKREYEMEVGNPRDYLCLSQGYPALFIEVSAAWAVPVAAGTSPHFHAAAFFAADQGIAEFPGLTGDQGVHHFQLFFRNLMGDAVLLEVGSEEIPEDMLLRVILMGIRF